MRFVDNGNSCHGSGGRGFPYDVELDCCISIHVTDKGAATVPKECNMDISEEQLTYILVSQDKSNLVV